jgi:hypothetical protein
MANNNVLLVAAFQGALAGSLSGRGGSYNLALGGVTVSVVQSCLALAEEIDSQIAFDSSITTGSGNAQILAIVGSSNAQIGPEFAKSRLLSMIVEAIVSGRRLDDITEIDYAALATYIVTLYANAVTLQAPFVP